MFMKHSFLRCLEESGCASPKSGWVPQHIAVFRASTPLKNVSDDDDDLIAYVPMYVKSHSMGEFIFDNAFADAAMRSGLDYYPKLLVAVPFTPATGSRILMNPKLIEGEGKIIRQEVCEYLRQITIGNGLSSLHFNFLTDEEATDIAGELDTEVEDSEETSYLRSIIGGALSSSKNKFNFLRRTSVQYHWENRRPSKDVAEADGAKTEPFEDFDDYLSFFKSKKRINIKRERRKIFDDEEIRVDAVRGKDILKYEGLVERMFDIYLSTINKMYWGRQYLTLDFFKMLSESDFIDNLLFMCARPSKCGDEIKAEDVFAGTFNIVNDGVFYGRYWGCLREVKNLHFEVCYWSAIEYCIDEGLSRMEPGAGGGDYKFARGFDPVLIHSSHFFSHPGLSSAVKQYIEMERQNNVGSTEYLKARSRVGKGTLIKTPEE